MKFKSMIFFQFFIKISVNSSNSFPNGSFSKMSGTLFYQRPSTLTFKKSKLYEKS